MDTAKKLLAAFAVRPPRGGEWRVEGGEDSRMHWRAV